MTGFAEFFKACRGHDAYSWQIRLAERLAFGKTPTVVCPPTGAGKTATVEALVWALAQQVDRPPATRTIGVRTVWAIDRRVLVDEVHDEAVKLADRLAAALTDADGPMRDVARRLVSYTDGSDTPGRAPLVVQRWRGNLRIESRAEHPLQPQIITSTVAQIGSRVLFRGYGVGERSLQLEAGLAAVDATICLDEAHLSGPLRQTLDSVVALRRREAVPLPPLTVIALTATPPAAGRDDTVIDIDERDREALGSRYTGIKHARLVEPQDDSDAQQIASLTQAVAEHLSGGAMRVACVVNTVRMASAVNARLAKRGDIDRALLVGPQRSADRAALLAAHRETLFGDAVPPCPLVVVATQTFEVGLDADVDALVTQSASATALVQRFGRLNRRGERAGAATIVRDTASALYARDEPAAWEWLVARADFGGVIDMSVAALRRDPPPQPAAEATMRAPLLTETAVELFAQTSPQPAPMTNPDVDPFLRGVGAEASADVSIAWRCDLRLDIDGSEGTEYRHALLRLAPPVREELLTLDIGRARALLLALAQPGRAPARLTGSVVDAPDIEGAATPFDLSLRLDGPLRLERFVVLRGIEHHEAVIGTPGPGEFGLRDLRPGDVIVLPHSAGGYADGALAAQSRQDVPDLGAGALHPAARSPEAERGPEPGIRITRELLDLRGVEVDAVMRIAAAVDGLPPDAAPGVRAELVGQLVNALGITAEVGTLELRRVTPEEDRYAVDLVLIDDADDSPWGPASVMEGERDGMDPAYVLVVGRSRDEVRPVAATPPTLVAHTEAVLARLTGFLGRAGLPSAVDGALLLAARAHDLGKADPRQQAYFWGGVAPPGAELIAKSVFGTDDRRAHRAAKAAAGLPDALRHEVLSVAVLEDSLRRGTVRDLPAEYDLDLGLHGSGTHHGLGIPIPPVPRGGTSAATFRVDVAGITGSARGDASCGWDDGAWLRRHMLLLDRYGPWGLAYLIGLLVLADRSVSREGR